MTFIGYDEDKDTYQRNTANTKAIKIIDKGERWTTGKEKKGQDKPVL